jgi:dihydroorotate dehydrogenase (NAD+) catalytic subunit
MGLSVNEKSSPDTRTELAGVKLSNPVMPASGTFGYGMEYKDLYDLNELGAVVTKSVTREPRYGNELPRIAECTSGMLNSIGLQNPGLDHYMDVDLPALREVYHGPLIANVSGFSLDEFTEVAGRVGSDDRVDILEVNISCPNVDNGGSAFGCDPVISEKITKAVRGVTDKPVFMKLTPNVTDITEIAKACESGGADGISLINNFKAMKIDLANRRTITAKKYAGLSGPAIKPIALRMVNEVFHSVSIPVIGIGGVMCADDVLEMVMAGASAVEIGSANLVDPWTCQKVVRELPGRMENFDIKDLDEIRGVI